jgi:hypothetical protein
MKPRHYNNWWIFMLITIHQFSEEFVMRKISGVTLATCSVLATASSMLLACGSSAKVPSAPSAPVVQADEFYISPKSDVVFSIDVAGLRGTPYFQYFEAKFKANIDQMIGEFSKNCGFDPMAAIKSIAGGVQVAKDQSTVGTVVIRGITKTQISPCLAKQVTEGKATMADGVWRTTKGAEPVTMTFLADDVALLMMQPSEVTAANLAEVTAGSAGINTSPAFSQMWASAPAGQMRVAINGRASMFEQVRNMGINPNTLVASTMMTGDMTLAGVLKLDSAASAKGFVDQYSAFKGVAGGFVKSIDVKANDDQVLFSATISPEQTESLIGMATGFGGAE